MEANSHMPDDVLTLTGTENAASSEAPETTESVGSFATDATTTEPETAAADGSEQEQDPVEALRRELKKTNDQVNGFKGALKQAQKEADEARRQLDERSKEVAEFRQWREQQQQVEQRANLSRAIDQDLGTYKAELEARGIYDETTQQWLLNQRRSQRYAEMSEAMEKERANKADAVKVGIERRNEYAAREAQALTQRLARAGINREVQAVEILARLTLPVEHPESIDEFYRVRDQLYDGLLADTATQSRRNVLAQRQASGADKVESGGTANLSFEALEEEWARTGDPRLLTAYQEARRKQGLV